MGQERSARKALEQEVRSLKAKLGNGKLTESGFSESFGDWFDGGDISFGEGFKFN